MTAPDPAPATLDAAVEAAARFAYERACSVAAAPEQMVTWDRLSGHMRRYYLIQYGPVVAAAAPILAAADADQLAQAHAAGTAEGAAAERERIAQAIWEYRDRRPNVAGEELAAQRALFQAVRIADDATCRRLRDRDAIARAGTSGDAT